MASQPGFHSDGDMSLLDDNADLPPPRKQESEEVSLLEQLRQLNEDEIVRGYRAGWDDPTVPISENKSFYHGWLNAQVDRGRMKPSDAMRKLAAEYVGRSRTAIASTNSEER